MNEAIETRAGMFANGEAVGDEAREPESATGALRRSPLEAAHVEAGAEMREHEGCRVPSHFGDAAAEYEAVRGETGAGLFDLSARGRVEVAGAEAVQFLNGMVTNDVAALKAGEWFECAFPNPQGRLLAPARVFRRGDSFLFDTEAATYAVMLRHLERFTLAGDFRVRDLTPETAHISVQGARAREVIRAALGSEAAGTERKRLAVVGFGAGEVTVARATHTAEDGFDLFVTADDARALWDALAGAGARRAGYDALEVLRVEAGLPRYGIDANEQNVVLEVVDEEAAVSYTKGCYAGQEIIARIHWRGHVAKRMTGLILEGFDERAAVDEKTADVRLRETGGEREAGRITSIVHSPRLGQMIALGLVKYDFLEHGTELRLFAGETQAGKATVVGLPLVHGSWYESESAPGAVGETQA